MTRIPLSDFLGGGAAVAPTPKRMKLEDFLAGGDPAPLAASTPVPLSVPFVNQPTIDPLGDMLRAAAPAPPVQGMPEVQGVLDNWNLSGYTDPELKNPPSFELPKSALTPTAISDFNERKRAEEAKAAQQRMDDLLFAFNGPNSGDPYKEGDKRLDHRYRNELVNEYYGGLPYPMTGDVLAARLDPSTKHVYDRFRRLNELATGNLLLDEPQSTTQEDRDYRQKMIDNERAMMQARGLDPAQYLAELESFDGQQGFFGRNAAAMGNAASDVARNIYDLATDTGGGQNVQGTRMRQQDAAWRETIEDVKDERSALPNWANEVARSSAQATPQLAGAAVVGAATRNPALATATMLGPAALDTYQTGRANGMSEGAAVGRALALAGVEYATMKAGGAIAGTFGGRTFEEVAFGTGAKSTQRGLLGTLAEKAGSGATEGGEEVAAAIAQQVGDHLIGLEDELIGDETPEQLALAFAVGFVASGAMHGINSFSEFVQNPTKQNAEAAGITEELAPTQADRESLAAAAAEKMVAEPVAGGLPGQVADISPEVAPNGENTQNQVADRLPDSVAEQLPPPAEPAPKKSIGRRIEPVSEDAPVEPQKRSIGKRKTVPNVTTLTGREISAPPQVTGGGDRKTVNQVRSQLQWLLDQGIAEAESRGDDFNLSWMRNEKVGNLSKGSGLPQATIDSLNEYLFGEQSPSWDSQTGARIESGQELSSPPPVIPPITRPLAPDNSAPPVDVQPDVQNVESPSVAPPDAPPVAPSQAPADSGVATQSLAELRKEYDDAIKAADAEFAATEKALGSEKAKLQRSRVKDKASRLEALEEQYRQAKDVRQKQYQESGRRFRELSENSPEMAQEKAQQRESLARIRKEQEDRDAAARSSREERHWREVQDKGGYEIVKAQEETRVRDIEGRLKRTKDQNKFKLESTLRNAKGNLEYLESLNRKFGQTPAPPAQVEAVAPKKSIGKKRELPPVLKAAEFKQKLRDAATTQEEGDNLYRIVEARADAAGESVDEYVGKRIADIMKADRVDSEYLKQLASGKGDALAQGQPIKTDTPEFKAWFGASKVTDADGKPLVVYHGTTSPSEFNKFEAVAPTDVLRVDGQEVPIANSWDMGRDSKGMPEGYHYGAVTDARQMGAQEAYDYRLKEAKRFAKPDGSISDDAARHIADLKRLIGKTIDKSTETRPSGDGHYFTPSLGYSFTRDIGNFNNGRVVPVYLSIKNPKIMNASEIESAGRSWRVEELKKQGYDGAIFASDPKDITKDGWSGSTQIVAFDPTQIKSAIGNSGKFDPNDPSILAQAAYHGTPHRFDKFTLDKIGTGEGAQAYGWGLYFAGNKEVARYYREKLSDGWKIDDDIAWRSVTPTEAYSATEQEFRERLAKKLRSTAADNRRYGYEELADQQEAAAAKVESGEARATKSGALYKVDLKPSEDEYLDWDKPLSEQSEKVKNVLRQMPLFEEMQQDSPNNERSITGERFYRAAEERYGEKRRATIALQSFGIRGIRFLDGSSRSRGEGHHNYVIFDDADVVIEEVLAQRNGKAPKPNAEIQFLAEDGRAIIRAFREGQNLSSLIHELFHVFELDLTDAQRASLDGWLTRGPWTYNGAKPGKTKAGKWNRAAREKFARAGERYMREGKAPTPELEGVFAKFKEWLSSVYKAIKGSPIDVELSPEIRAVMDSLFAKKTADSKRQTRPVAIAIPNDIQVAVEAIKAKTGERVKVKKNARDAYVELDEDAKLYKQLINCLGK